jgi:predicted membrane channel-forming protein YqfA (hemolysin III family)
LKEELEKKKQIIDYAGIFAFAASMTSFSYTLTLLREQKQMTSSIFLLLAVVLVGIGLFIWIEAKTKEPMLPLSLFKNRFINVSNIAGFLVGFICYSGNVAW